MFCTHCGEENNNDSKFCINCGSEIKSSIEILQLPEDDEQNAKISKNDNKVKHTLLKNNKRKTMLIVVSAISAFSLVLLVGFALLIYLSSERNASPLESETVQSPTIEPTLAPQHQEDDFPIEEQVTPTPLPTPEPIIEDYLPEPTINDITGVWEGEYVGISDGEQVTREIRLSVNYEDGGDISGITEITTDGEAFGQYFHSGTIDEATLQISLGGTEWIDNPYNMTFIEIDGVLDLSEMSIEGIVNADDSRPFLLEQASHSTDDIFRFQSSEFLGIWEGEYDGRNDDTRVRRRLILNFDAISEDDIISGVAEFFPIPGEPHPDSGSYHFSGYLNRITGEFYFQGHTWIIHPGKDDFHFVELVGIMCDVGYSITGKSRTGSDGLLFRGSPDIGTFTIFRSQSNNESTDTGRYEPILTNKVIRFPDGSNVRSVAVRWGAELFSQPSNEYNNELALLSAALSSAVYNITDDSQGDGHFIYEALITLDFDSENIRLYGYPGHKRNQDGKNDTPNIPGAGENYFSYAIASQDIIVNEESASLLVITLSGTQTFEEWTNNVLGALATTRFLRTYDVYDAFLNFYRRVANGLRDYRARHELSDNLYILITGHSLGGATAQLVSASIQNLDWADSSKVHTYTIGSPNPIAEETGSGIAGSYNNIFNIVNPGGDTFIDAPDSRKSKFGLILAVPSIREWGKSDDVSSFVREYRRITGGTVRNAMNKRGSHDKEAYIAWISANPEYGRKVAAGRYQFTGSIYSPDSPF